MKLTEGDRLVVVTCLKFCAVTEEQKAKMAQRQYRGGIAEALGRFSRECIEVIAKLQAPSRATLMLYDSDRVTILTALKICAMLHEKMAKAANDKRDYAAAKKSALFSGECARLVDLLENRPNGANGATATGKG